MKVLVVEDSRTVRAYVEGVLRGAPDIQVLPPALDGVTAVRLAQALRPDVILMDLELPELDGLNAIDHIMRDCPCPIVVLSGTLGDAEAGRTFAAFKAGAVEVMTKPQGLGAVDIERFRNQLLRTLRLMSQAHVVRRMPRSASAVPANLPVDPGSLGHRSLLLVGASTGGPEVLRLLLEGLPRPFPLPIVISQHIVVGFERGLASWLAQTGHACRVVEGSAALAPGEVLLAAADQDLVLNGARVETRPSRAGQISPNIDRLFASAVPQAAEVVAVLLSGMGEDGAQGLRSLRQGGALTLAQAGSSCVVDGMPAAARKLGASTWDLPPQELVSTLRLLVGPVEKPVPEVR